MTIFKTIAELFFRSVSSLKTKFSKTAISDGSVDSEGIATLSAHRTPSANGNAKITKIAPGAERLLDAETSVLQSDDAVYIEYTSSNGGERVGVMFDGTTVSSTTHPTSVVAIASAIVAYLVRDISDYEEFKGIFTQMVEELEHNGEISDSLYYSLCDSGYFSYLKDKKGFEVDEDLNLYELQMAVNNGHFKALFAEGSDDFSLIKFEGKDKSSSTSLNLSAQYETMWEEMKAGEWSVPFEWDEESLKYIPPRDFLTKYHPIDMFFEVAIQARDCALKTIEKMECGITLQQELMENIINAVLTGEPGTGKTILLYALASALQIPCYTIALDAKTEGDEFKGMIKVDNEGKLNFEYTDFLRGFTKGGIVILEEINLLDPNLAQGVLGQALESPYVIFKGGNQKVHRHPLCAIYSTMNTGTTGSMNLNQAFASRSPAVYVLDSVTKNDFVKALIAKFGTRFSVAQGEWVYKVWETAQNYLKQDTVQAEDIALAVSQRSCYELLKQIELTGNPKSAIRNTIFGTVFLYDPQIAQQLLKIIDMAVGAFPTA